MRTYLRQGFSEYETNLLRWNRSTKVAAFEHFDLLLAATESSPAPTHLMTVNLFRGKGAIAGISSL